MREINIKLTEKVLLDYTNYTVEQLSDANGYMAMVHNPDYVPEVGVEGEEGYVAAIGERTIPNPESRTVFLGKKFTEYGVKELSKPLKKNVVLTAQRQAESAFDAALDAVVVNAEIKTID